MTAKCEAARAEPLTPPRLLLHVLDTGERDALGPFLGVAEIEFILGEKHRIAVDVVGDAGAVGGDEGVELLAVIRRNPAGQQKPRPPPPSDIFCRASLSFFAFIASVSRTRRTISGAKLGTPTKVRSS